MFYPVVSKPSCPSPGDEEARSNHAIVCALPGWAYARALAFKAEGDNHATQVCAALLIRRYTFLQVDRT